MLDLGHNHPDFTYDNDERQVWMTLILEGLAAIAIVTIIAASVMSAQACSV